MSIKKDFFAPLALGLGATRRAAMLLLVMMLTTVTAWATTTSTINVGGTDYTLFTGFTATAGTASYSNFVDGNLSNEWWVKKNVDDPNAPAGDFNGGIVDPAFVEFHADAPIIPKGYVLTYDNSVNENWKPTSWALKAKLSESDNWTTIHSSNSSLGNGSSFKIPCNNDGNNQYQYFRFEIYEVEGTMMSILNELQFYGYENLTYTHLTVRAATCTEAGIKQECYKRGDGKYFSDENGTTELAEDAVIEPMKPHTGAHHDADANHIEYWQCSMCNKYFSDEACTNEITELQTHVVKYLDGNGTLTTLNEIATAVTSSSTSWNEGWYVVYDDVTITDRISVSGTVNLILFDGATLTANKGIGVGSSATFNVYAQSEDEATMGALVATATTEFNCAGIGGGNNSNFGTININGGKITATGNNAGIGGGYGSTSGNITINGGIVNATADGYSNSAGIGGGNNGYVTSVTLNGGVITATGDTQSGGAGIGTGAYASSGTMTITIGSGVKRIVATKGWNSECIGKGYNASTTVNVVFKHNNNEVTGDDKDAVFSDSGEGTSRTIFGKVVKHSITISDDIKASVTASIKSAPEGETVTLTLNPSVDASTLKVNDGTNDLTLTDIGNRQYTFVMPNTDVTVTATVAATYSVTLPTNMEIVSATNTADGDGKYISGTTVTFKALFPYTASNVSDGTNTLEPDANGIYSVTIGTSDVTISATIERSSTINLADAPGDFTAINNDVLTGSTSHTVTIADNAGITLSGATINGGIVCAGTAEITLVGTNSVTGLSRYDPNIEAYRYTAGIQVGGSGTTLTIKGNGSLTANGAQYAAGIGLNGAFNVTEDVIGGNIVIESGIIAANGGKGAAGIGAGFTKDKNISSSRKAIVGNITIKGGTVTAVGVTADGGNGADGIGAGDNIYHATYQIGTVTIYDDIDKVDASSINDFGSVVYKHGETNVTASKTDYFTIGTDGNRRLIVQKPVIADVPEQTYTGSEIKPEPQVTIGSLILTKGTDYDYSYTDNTNVGTATATVTFKGDYTPLGSVAKEFTILPSTVVVNVTGNGTVTYNDKSAASGETFGVAAEKGTDVTLTLAPESGYAVSIAYGYTNNSWTASGLKLPINGTTATLTVPNDMKDGTYVNLTVTFVSALAGGADEASAVALTDNTVTNFAGGWYKVDSDITFDHTLNLLGDTHLIIDDGKTMTVNTATSEGILSDYTLFVSGEGTLSVATTGDYGIAVCVGNYVQTGATVTASGYIGIRCTDDFIGFDFDNDFTFSGGQLTATGNSGGIWADNDITLSCTNATDFIQASSYSSGYGAVKIADGKALTDGTVASNGMNGYSGTLTYEQRIAIGGKTLRRAVITSYVEASGTLHENVIAIPLDNTMTTLAAGWYVVNENVDYTGQITLSGDVTLILGDGCIMSIGKDEQLNATIMDCQNHNLTIYGQSGGTGWLKAYSEDGINNVNYYTQYSGNVVIFDGNGACIYANNSVTLLGGTLDVESGEGANGDISGGSISILGGKLWARYKGLKTMSGKIILGYTNATDQIYVKAYNPQNGLQIADGKTLVDDYGVIWSGTLDNDQIEHGINNRTLKPLDYTGVTLTKEYYNVSATFNGSSETTVSIPVDVEVNSVTYNRTFTEGKPSTVMLPFSLGEGQTLTGGTLYKFTGVTKNETAGKWEATMTETATLQANTPYLLMPNNELVDGKVTFNLGSSWSTVTLNTTGGGNCLDSDTEGWVFHGTYSKKLWNEVETHDYGFAASSGTSADDKSVEAGQFVRLTTGASAKPMRCYLSYVGVPNQARSLSRGAAATEEELPSSIIVRLVGANGQTTGIGTIDNGQWTIDNYADADGWYDLQGRKLSGKPTQKGLYINNGKKIVIK